MFVIGFFNLLWFQLPRFPNSVASLSFNQRGQLLAIASSYTYQEANEMLVFFYYALVFSISTIPSTPSSNPEKELLNFYEFRYPRIIRSVYFRMKLGAC